MRHTLYLAAFAASVMMISSCNKVNTEESLSGFGHELLLNQEKLEFSSQGGEAVIKSTNLPKCYVSEVEDKLTCVFYHPERDEQYNPISVKCEGIVVTTLDKVSVNVKVTESDSPHHWVLTMQSGDAFKPVDIVQK